MRQQRVAAAAAWVLFLVAGLAVTGGGPLWCAAAQGPSKVVDWTAIKGTVDFRLATVYGTQGVAAPANRPGKRDAAVTWTDASGNLWLFGGYGYAASENGYLNDLWKYDPSTGNWTWMKGASSANQYGTYGTAGIPAADNTPGARYGAVSWTDTSGKLWIFGGYGYVASGFGYLNELWKYDPSTCNWTWLNGGPTINQYGIYGTMGSPTAANMPGARRHSVSWTDTTGKLWMFGGHGYDSAGNVGDLNDLWKYDPSTGSWTWMKGCSTWAQNGIYGAQGTPATANTPGSRSGAVSWIDASGKLWLFGGWGYSGGTSYGPLNDLWEYDPGTSNWTWMKGASTPSQPGIYGTQGTAASTNTPGARYEAVSWMDSSGKLWLFGGQGYDSSGAFGYQNDLWRYDPATGDWTWMKGASTRNQLGTYGTQGTATAISAPGSREYAVAWTDASGKLWLFGGYGYGSSGYSDYLNDLWKYDPSGGNWTWMNAQNGTYGTALTPAPANVPGGRYGSVSWTDASSALWLFGGYGYGGSGSSGYLNELWKYEPSTGNWTWMNGGPTINQYGVYGRLGAPAVHNMPGARYGAVSWTDTSGKLWLFGGKGYDSAGSLGNLNDLWLCDPVTRNWTWMKGASTVNPSGAYGTVGIPDPANTPGARRDAVSWIDGSGKLWLFGGYGFDAGLSTGYLNDLWQYDPATGNWTWMKGASTRSQVGAYGTLGTPAADNTPGARSKGVSWTDMSGKFWIFGGYGYDTTDSLNYLNDLWRYDPTTNSWTWIKGGSTHYQTGIYGMLGTPSESNTPGARNGAVSWADMSGRLWLFVGTGYGGGASTGYLNDLWQ